MQPLAQLLKSRTIWFAILLAVTENGKPFAEQIKGNYFKPGDDYSAEEAKVQSVCALVHTAEVIAAYQATQQALTPG